MQNLMSNVVITIETTANLDYAAIVSIGAASFDPETGVAGEHLFYCELNWLNQNFDYNLAICPKVMDDWVKRSKKARSAMKGTGELRDMLLQLSEWYIANSTCDVKVWADQTNGTLKVLENAFNAVKSVTPCSPENTRCYLTIEKTFSELLGTLDCASQVPDGTALDLALHKAKSLNRYLRTSITF